MKYLLVFVCLVMASDAGFLGGGRQHGGFPGGFGAGRPVRHGNRHGVGYAAGGGIRQGGYHHHQQQQAQGAILLIKQPTTKRHGGAGRSLTVSGPTHLVRTIHHIERVDNGGQVLARSHGGGSKQRNQPKYLLLVKTDQAGGAQHSHGHGHQRQKQQQGGW